MARGAHVDQHCAARSRAPGHAQPDHLGHVAFIAAAAAMGGFLFGYDSAVINGAVEAIRDRQRRVGSAALARSSPSR
ncbi:hypothetical protein [Streptomyces sp. KL116D]|uniref:hypothetical protein n=1 Tax=Streptomyces sp. KL116D TaxID=3045152 RepID=UPI003558E91D